MVASLTVKLTGLREVEQVLKRLPERTAKRVLRAALRRGATALRREIQARTPRGSGPAHPKYGRGWRNIRVATLKASASEVAFAVHSGDAFWLRYYEFGTRRQPPRPLFRAALDEQGDAILARVQAAIGQGILREADKLAGEYATARRAMGVR